MNPADFAGIFKEGRMTFGTRILFVTCSAGALAAGMPAMAQTAPAAAAAQTSVFDTEIVVTAQKRSENVQDVAISISTYSGTQLRALGIVIDVCKEVSPETSPSELAAPVMMPILMKFMADHPEYVTGEE